MSSSQKIRRRTSSSSVSTAPHRARTSGGGLTVGAMLTASPQQTGSVQKLQVPLIYWFLPAFLQRLLWKLPAWISFWRPSWDSRFLMLLGSYLYKFADASPEEQPKGGPVPVDSINSVHLVDADSACTEVDDAGVGIAGAILPDGSAVFCVETYTKRYYYACTDREQAVVWVNSLIAARQEAVKRSLGHAPTGSVSIQQMHYDSLGRDLYESKNRVRSRMAQHNISGTEMEMSVLSSRGGLLV